jgi:hypothetical protein
MPLRQVTLSNESAGLDGVSSGSTLSRSQTLENEDYKISASSDRSGEKTAVLVGFIADRLPWYEP